MPDDPRAMNDGCVRGDQLGDRTDVLRVRKLEYGSHAGQWAWFASRLAPTGPGGLRRYSNADGYCDTKEEAQAAAEGHYFRR